MEDEEREVEGRPVAKVSRRTTLWSPKLLDLIRTVVLKDDSNDFVIAEDLSLRMKIARHEVGACLSRLVREGLLLPRCPVSPVDRDGDPVSVQIGPGWGRSITWNGKAWVYRSESYKTSRKTGRRRHAEGGRSRVRMGRNGPLHHAGLRRVPRGVRAGGTVRRSVPRSVELRVRAPERRSGKQAHLRQVLRQEVRGRRAEGEVSRALSEVRERSPVPQRSREETCRPSSPQM